VAHRQRPEQIPALGNERDALGEQFALRLAVDAFAFEAHLPGAGHKHAEQSLEDGRLAGAVGSDQQRDLAAARVQRGLVQNGEARRIPGDDTVEFDDLVCGHESPGSIA
jgi:hypothetical protein